MIRIEIETDNEAFGDPFSAEWSYEAITILQRAGKMLQRMSGPDEGKLRDSNGNTVGKVVVE
jgi:hypothetical protein